MYKNRVNFDHGVLARGYCAERGTDYWKGTFVAEVFEQLSDRRLRRSVDI